MFLLELRVRRCRCRTLRCVVQGASGGLAVSPVVSGGPRLTIPVHPRPGSATDNWPPRLSLPGFFGSRPRWPPPIREGGPRPPPDPSAPEPQARDERSVALDVLPPEIVQETTPLADHLKQPATRVMVLRVGLQMLGQGIDALGQDR